MPIELEGPWEKGYAIDVHTLKSEYLGDDSYGRPQFKNTRSEIGELVYRLKYLQDKTVVSRIVTIINSQIQDLKQADVIVPVPPSNRRRIIQPVHFVAKALAVSLSVPLLENALIKNNEEELKNVGYAAKRASLLREGMVLQNIADVKDKKVLLMDDLYRSGATLEVATQLLYENGHASEVYALVLTKTRSNR